MTRKLLCGLKIREKVNFMEEVEWKWVDRGGKRGRMGRSSSNKTTSKSTKNSSRWSSRLSSRTSSKSHSKSMLKSRSNCEIGHLSYSDGLWAGIFRVSVCLRMAMVANLPREWAWRSATLRQRFLLLGISQLWRRRWIVTVIVIRLFRELARAICSRLKIRAEIAKYQELRPWL